ncbi:hypothetical protein [Rhizorhapis sp.]|uniref:hypothetical protein n=1 Tax=Rhizorhapis sp. TaxID=1968842 RepID=UPI002B479B9C|nr:hypothetical protein [Rhizorhapis sp.]HKR16615.1 hypothetical protein [Rhizorhapis sp.]
MTIEIEAALLRQFIRFGIPPMPRDCVARRYQHENDLEALHERNSRPSGTNGALTVSEFEAELKRLEREFESDILRLLADPHSYRYWKPTAENWRRLAICQAMYAHKSSTAEPSLLVPLPRKGRGRPKADLWHRAHYVYSARAILAKEKKIPVREVSQKAASEKAAKLIAEAARAGHWRGKVPSATTIEEAWSDLYIDDEQKSPDLPAWMMARRDIQDHLKRIEAAADCLGLQSQMAPDLHDFLAWLAGQITADEQLAATPSDWAEYHQQLGDLPVATQTKFQAAMEDYLKLLS